MPEPDDNSQAAVYLSKTNDTRSGVPEVWLNVYETPGNRSYQAQCPEEIVGSASDVQVWADNELEAVGLKVGGWDSAPGWPTWETGEYDYRSTGVQELAQPVPAGPQDLAPALMAPRPALFATLADHPVPSIPQGPPRTR